MARSFCLNCGRPCYGSRCPEHQALFESSRQQAKGDRYGQEWQALSRGIRRSWIREHGWVCPGWADQSEHAAADLVVDHDVGVLCRACNGVKAATHDKTQAALREER